MKKKLIQGCAVCPDFDTIDSGGDVVYCPQSTLTLNPYIPPDCPLPDEPEWVRGKLNVETYLNKYDWWIDLGYATVEGQKMFESEAEARADAAEWAKKLNVEVT